MSATIVIGKGAATKGYTTKVVTISQGGSLSVVNLDNIEHTVTSVAQNANGAPLFDHFALPGSTSSIPGGEQARRWHLQLLLRVPSQRHAGHADRRGQPGGGGTHPVPPKFVLPLRIPKVLSRRDIRRSR